MIIINNKKCFIPFLIMYIIIWFTVATNCHNDLKIIN